MRGDDRKHLTDDGEADEDECNSPRDVEVAAAATTPLVRHAILTRLSARERAVK